MYSKMNKFKDIEFRINEILFLKLRGLPELRSLRMLRSSVHSVNMSVRALGCSHVFSIFLFIEITSFDEEAFKTLNYKHSNIRIGNIYLIIMNLDT